MHLVERRFVDHDGVLGIKAMMGKLIPAERGTEHDRLARTDDGFTLLVCVHEDAQDGERVRNGKRSSPTLGCFQTQNFGKSLNLRFVRAARNVSCLQRLRKLSGLDSNQQPSGQRSIRRPRSHARAAR